MIAERRFRQDLYYRINTLRLSLPALRDRPSDIALLAQMLVGRSLIRLGSELDAEPVLTSLLPYLAAYVWPGNVREMENIADRIAVYLLQFDDLDSIDYHGSREDCPELFLRDPFDTHSNVELLKVRLADELTSSKGNRKVAAQKLGISRSTLWRWMKEHKVD